MHADAQDQEAVRQHALEAMKHLGDEDRRKILEYMNGLITLEEVKHDQASPSQD